MRCVVYVDPSVVPQLVHSRGAGSAITEDLRLRLHLLPTTTDDDLTTLPAGDTGEHCGKLGATRGERRASSRKTLKQLAGTNVS